MLLGPGVQLLSQQNHEVGVDHAIAASSNVAVVDTYFRNTISTASAVLQSVVDSLAIPEYYSYDFAQLVVSFLAQPLHFSPPGPRSPTAAGAAIQTPKLLIVLVLRPSLHSLVRDPQLLWPLIEAHELGRRRGVVLNTIIFTAPLTSKPRI